MEHFEDIIIRQGPTAQLKAIANFVAGLSPKNPNSTVVTKYDGVPSVEFARDAEGKFTFNDKGRYNAKTYNGKAETPGALKETILRKKTTKSQVEYAENMAKLFTYIDELTEGIVGHFDADVLWFSSPKKDWVKPNRIRYVLEGKGDKDSGIVIHRGPVEMLPQNKNIYWQGPEYVACTDAACIIGVFPDIKDVSENINRNFKIYERIFKDKDLCSKIYSWNCRNTTFTEASIKMFAKTIRIDMRQPVIKLGRLIAELNEIKNETCDLLEAQRIKDGKMKQYFGRTARGEGFVVVCDEPYKLVKRDFRRK